MPLQRLTLDHLCCFVIGFPLLDTTEYPQSPFTVAKISLYWVQHNNRIPLLHLAVCRYSHTCPSHPIRQTH
jgi:hypothetical protein